MLWYIAPWAAVRYCVPSPRNLLDPHLTSTSQLLDIHSLKSQPETGLKER